MSSFFFAWNTSMPDSVKNSVSHVVGYYPAIRKTRREIASGCVRIGWEDINVGTSISLPSCFQFSLHFSIHSAQSYSSGYV